MNDRVGTGTSSSSSSEVCHEVFVLISVFNSCMAFWVPVIVSALVWPLRLTRRPKPTYEEPLNHVLRRRWSYEDWALKNRPKLFRPCPAVRLSASVRLVNSLSLPLSCIWLSVRLVKCLSLDVADGHYSLWSYTHYHYYYYCYYYWFMHLSLSLTITIIATIFFTKFWVGFFPGHG